MLCWEGTSIGERDTGVTSSGVIAPRDVPPPPDKEATVQERHELPTLVQVKLSSVMNLKHLRFSTQNALLLSGSACNLLQGSQPLSLANQSLQQPKYGECHRRTLHSLTGQFLSYPLRDPLFKAGAAVAGIPHFLRASITSATVCLPTTWLRRLFITVSHPASVFR